MLSWYRSFELEVRIWGRWRSSGYGSGAFGGGLEPAADAGDDESRLLIRRGPMVGDSCLAWRSLRKSSSGWRARLLLLMLS